MTYRRSIAALALAAFLPLAAAAETLDDAAAARERGDYVAAAQMLRSLADTGDAEAQYDLGVLYVQGLGVPQSNAHAMKWFQRAAAQGDARAQYNLGAMYSAGRGGRQTYASADPWGD